MNGPVEIFTRRTEFQIGEQISSKSMCPNGAEYICGRFIGRSCIFCIILRCSIVIDVTEGIIEAQNNLVFLTRLEGELDIRIERVVFPGSFHLFVIRKTG